MSPVSDGRLTVALLAAAFLIRLAAWMGAAIFGTDGCHYLLMADWMGEGRFSDALSLQYHPMYPLLIAIARVPVGDTVIAGGLVAVALGASAVVPLFKTVRAVFGRPEAFVTSLLYAFNPVIVEVQSDVMTEGPFAFFFLASIWLTWRTIEEPSAALGATLGLAAAAAYLTRPEGLLAIAFAAAWPLIELVRRADRRIGRAGGVALTLLVALIAIFPYLLWIRASRGHWDLSARPSMAAAMRSVSLPVAAEAGDEASGRYVTFLKSIYRLTYLVTIPFYLMGLAELWRRRARGTVFLLSFPAAYLCGILIALRSHNFMSYRYVLPAMSVLGTVAAVGMIATMRWAGGRWPGARWIPTAGMAGLLLLTTAPASRVLRPSRMECRSYYEAARWIEAHGRPQAISGPIQQVAYLTGSRSVYSGQSHEEIRRQVSREKVGYYVYTEKDVENRPGYVAMLRSCDALETPVEIVGPPGTWKVYVQKAK